MHLRRKRVEFIDLSIFGDLELPRRIKTIALASSGNKHAKRGYRGNGIV
jgi:hypothetical protein